MSTAGSRILRSVRNARRFARGETTEGFVVHVPAEVDVGAIRRKLGLSQAEFAARFGFSVAAVRDWEQRRRHPEQAARVLLMVIELADSMPRPLPQSLANILRLRIVPFAAGSGSFSFGRPQPLAPPPPPARRCMWLRPRSGQGVSAAP